MPAAIVVWLAWGGTWRTIRTLTRRQVSLLNPTWVDCWLPRPGIKDAHMKANRFPAPSDDWLPFVGRVDPV